MKNSKQCQRILTIALSVIISTQLFSQTSLDYLNAIKDKGQDPVNFVKEALQQYDLLIFDDALHAAQEPFDFYGTLIKEPEINSKIQFVFIEVFSIAAQTALDQYMNGPSPDSTLLLPVLQNDFSGFGWKYETYINLLKTIWKVNKNLPIGKKIRVIGVDQPIFWEGIRTTRDYEVFNNSLDARDYFMFLQITNYMNDFKEKSKGIFLTNTRHAYTNLHNKEGHLIWNCGTFFRQRFPDKTLSVRIHNVNLKVSGKTDVEAKTAAGMESYQYTWVKMEDGKWDNAFALNNNKPIALYLKNTPFGTTPYIGNQMLNTRKDQTMVNAYDALVFLAPLDSLHFSGSIDFIYTDNFKKELKRRIIIIYGDNVNELLSEYGTSTVDECIDVIIKREGKTLNKLAR